MDTRASSEVWKYFKKKGVEKAQCNRCPKILSCKGSSTSGLLRHLSTVHSINLKKQPEEVLSDNASTSASSPTPGTSKSSQGPQPSKKRKAPMQTSIDKHLKKPNTMAETISKLAATDGLSIRAITNSEVIRSFASQAGLNIPKCESQVMKIIIDFAEEKKQEIISILNKYLKNDKRLSISLDEWTSIRNRRYFNLNLHDENGKVYNLGLTYIPGKCGASETRKIVETILTEFNIDFERDIVAVTSDGPNVMKKFGRESPAEMVLCMNHAIHLAVTDVLYTEKTAGECESNSEESDSDSDCYEYDEHSEVITNRDIRPDLKNILEETRKIINLFRRSPLKNAKLQEYVRSEHNKEKSLFRDVKTRWNSIETMISRFVEIKNCIKKALIDLDNGNLWHEQNITILEELLKILNPVKLAVEALSSRKADILICEAVITTLLGRLKKLDSPLAVEFLDCLTQRINERRDASLYTLILFLQSPTIRANDHITESAIRKDQMIQYSEQLFRRLFPQKSESNSSPEQTLQEISDKQKEVSFAEELQDAIQNVVKGKPPPRTQHLRLKKDFDLYTSSGKRTPNLELLYNALRSIRCTSTESERTFSVSGNFATKIRSRLSDKSLSSLVFLKYYFKNEISDL